MSEEHATPRCFGPIVPVVSDPNATYCDPAGHNAPPPGPASDTLKRNADAWLRAVTGDTHADFRSDR